MEEKNPLSENKKVIVIIGADIAPEKLEVFLAENADYISRLKQEDMSAEDVLSVLEKSHASDDFRPENCIFYMSADNLRRLEQILRDKSAHKILCFSRRELPEDSGYLFPLRETKDKSRHYVPKKIGVANTRVKGGNRRRHFIITRPWLLR